MAGVDAEPLNAPQRISALSPLRYPVFRAVWAASTLSNIGAVIQSVGASWMMISISESATMVALVQASVALPIVLLALAAGAIADNVDRRKRDARRADLHADRVDRAGCVRLVRA